MPHSDTYIMDKNMIPVSFTILVFLTGINNTDNNNGNDCDLTSMLTLLSINMNKPLGHVRRPFLLR